MKIVFLSNYLNHHQQPFLESLVALGCDVTFVAFATMSEMRRNLGYSDVSFAGRHIQYQKEMKEEIIQLVMEADAVIFGVMLGNLCQKRIESGKLTFRFSERLFKTSFLQEITPWYLAKYRKKYVYGRNTPYLLGAGAYAAADFKKLGYPKDKLLKWGYFPPVYPVDLDELKKRKKQNEIVWVSRFIEWKHPEYVVQLGRYLRKHDVPFHIQMIGTGERLLSTMELVEKYGLTGYIDIVGPMPSEQVHKEFETAQIALLTSDRKEGWGAVINEAMSSACAVVASNRVGSVSSLIKNKINGMTYGVRKRKMFRIVRQLLQDPQRCEQLGEAAYNTITKEWNHQVAAERLLAFIQDQSVEYPEGPMSRA